MLEEIKRKLLEGTLAEEEWRALGMADREKARAAAAEEAVRRAMMARAAASDTRFTAGLLFTEEDKPPEGAEVLLPVGYLLGSDGVYRAKLAEEDDTVRVGVTRLTTVPIFIAARDGSGRVRVMLRPHDVWVGEWVQVSRLTSSWLADRYVLPAPGAKVRDTIEYLHHCVASAPFRMARDEIAMAAVEILMEFFPAKAAGVEFPALRAFHDVRKKAEERGVDPLAVRQWWQRQGLIGEGPGKVVRQGASTARMIVFTERVKQFLSSLPADEEPARGREGAIFRIKILTGPEAGQEKLVALSHAQVVPLGAETPSPVNPLATALTGRHWPGEVVEVRAREPYQIQILEIDPVLKEPAHQEAQAS